MATFIILLVLAIVSFSTGFSFDPQSAPQQTIQYLVFVCGSIFAAACFICLQLYLNTNRITEVLNKGFQGLMRKKENLNISEPQPLTPNQVNLGDLWTCKSCGEQNPMASTFCKSCGSYK